MIEEHWPEADTGEDPPEGPWPDEGDYYSPIDLASQSLALVAKMIAAYNASVEDEKLFAKPASVRAWDSELADQVGDIQKYWQAAMHPALAVVEDITTAYADIIDSDISKIRIAPSTGPIRDPFRRRGKG